MTDLRSAAQQALEALESLFTLQADDARPKRCGDAITVLRAALEQPEPPPEAQTEAEKIAYCAGWWAAMETKAKEQAEQKAECDGGTCGLGGYCDGCPNRPVAWQWLNTAHFRKKLPADAEPGAWNPLYTHPPRREWRGLTVEFICEAIDDNGLDWHNGWTIGDDSVNRYLNLARAIEAALKERNA